MVVKRIDPHYVRTWYGLSAEIVVDQDFWHRVRVGRISLPHPPLVNLVLRRGQPRQERVYLSFLHEFGHLQTLPLALAHVLFLAGRGRRQERGRKRGLIALVAAIIAHQALWELASESYVAFAAGRKYGRIYRRYPNPRGHLVFWGGMAALAFSLSRWVLRKEGGNSR